MYGLRSSDGSRIWQYSIGPVGANYSSPETPVVVDKVVYVTTVNGEVYALNTNTVSLIWSYKAASIDGGSVTLTSLIVLNGVVYAGGNNVGGDNSGNLYALNSSNGSIIWQYQIKGEGITSLAADKDKVYVGTSKYPTVASVYALRASDARLLWHSQAEGITNLLTVANGDVYGSSLDGYSNTVIYRLHASDGTTLWSVRIPRNAGIPRVVKEVVYITSEYRSGRNVDALQAGNGSFLWEAEPDIGHVCTQNCSIG